MLLAGIQSPGFELEVHFVDWMTQRIPSSDARSNDMPSCFYRSLSEIEHCELNIDL